MKSQDTRKLDRLLSGGEGLSVQEKETLLQAVLDGSATEPTARPLSGLRWVWAPVAGVLAIGAAILTWMLWTPSPPGTMPDTDGFARKGLARPAPLLTLTCSRPGQETPALENHPRCRPGDTLLFALPANPPDSYFSAASVGPGGLLVWYFPSQSDASLPTGSGGLLQRGIELGPEHPRGEYQVLGALSDAPLTQEGLRQAIEAYLTGKPPQHPLITAGFSLELP